MGTCFSFLQQGKNKEKEKDKSKQPKINTCLPEKHEEYQCYHYAKTIENSISYKPKNESTKSEISYQAGNLKPNFNQKEKQSSHQLTAKTVPEKINEKEVKIVPITKTVNEAASDDFSLPKFNINPEKIVENKRNSEQAEKSTENTLIPKTHNNLEGNKEVISNKSPEIIEENEDPTEYPPKQLKSDRNIGLLNIGNTCYMNSIIQIFASIPEFIKSIEASKNPFFISLTKLIAVLKSSYNVLDTKQHLIDFKKAISEEYQMYQGAFENDAKELFSIITNEADELDPKNKQFTLTKIQKFTCREGHFYNNSEEANFLVFNQKNLKNFIKNIKSKTRFDGDNKLFCEVCQNLQDTEMEVVGIDWPNILTFYLPGSQSRINLPENLEYEEVKYAIFGAICYYGNHFVAFVKDENWNRWKEFNDSLVEWRDPDWGYLYLVFYRKMSNS